MTSLASPPSVQAGAPRRILLVGHPGRREVVEIARGVVQRLVDAGVEVALPPTEQEAFAGIDIGPVQPSDPLQPASGCELVVVLGGDGTILRGAECSRGSNAPLLGVNLGHVGFLAEAEREEVAATVGHILERSYGVEERMTLDVTVFQDGSPTWTSWSLNEVSVEKAARERMLEVTLEIEDRPLSTWGCDGVVVATPTGSTAYAFSAGGPVIWPDVEAILVVPNSAHALFARAIVVGPAAHVAIEVVADTTAQGVVWCDGRRQAALPPGARVAVRRSEVPVLLARFNDAPFADRLVAKFDLSVEGWRGSNGVGRGAAPGGAGDDAAAVTPSS